jgi:hypothetical protein
MQLLSLGLISPAKAYKYLDMADFKSLEAQFQADEDQAMREHDKLIEGKNINQAAALQAESQIMMQMQNPQFDPNTGQPMPLDQNMLMQAMDAGLQPLPFENKAAHLETHALFMKSPDFEKLPSEVQTRFFKHYDLTRAAVQAEAAPQGEPPRVSLQLRGAVGPTVGSKMLTQSGVKNVTPEELLEPPLDTVVIDNKDKPNVGEGVPGEQAQIQQDLLNKLVESDALHQQKMRQQMQERTMKVGL